MNVRYRVELSQTERAELTALLSTTAKARAKMGRAYPEPISAKSPSAKES